VLIDNPLGPLETPVREGYTFLGWYTSPDSTIKANPQAQVHSDVTYYAHWSPLEQVKVGAPRSGDLNGDGIITVSEAFIAARTAILGTDISFFSSNEEIKAKQIAALDIDDDGFISMGDAMRILMKATGL
jgi:uncharacterized repeat protein (TIGR02543 family)